jgi:hypothetical protein
VGCQRGKSLPEIVDRGQKKNAAHFSHFVWLVNDVFARGVKFLTSSQRCFNIPPEHTWNLKKLKDLLPFYE